MWKAAEVVTDFSRSFMAPGQHEGFIKITSLSTNLEIRNEMKRLHALCPSKAAKKG